MKKWKCNQCGKELKLEDKLFNLYYQDKEMCLECNNEKFMADTNKTADGKWRMDITVLKNTDGKKNDVVPFQCNECDKIVQIERTMYETVYLGQNLCWSCRNKN